MQRYLIDTSAVQSHCVQKYQKPSTLSAIIPRTKNGSAILCEKNIGYTSRRESINRISVPYKNFHTLEQSILPVRIIRSINTAGVRVRVRLLQKSKNEKRNEQNEEKKEKNTKHQRER